MNIMSIAWSIWMAAPHRNWHYTRSVGQWHYKNYTIAGGRQHGLQACTVSFLPALVKQEIWEQTIMEHSIASLPCIFPQPSQSPPKQNWPINSRPTAKVEGRKKRPTLRATISVIRTEYDRTHTIFKYNVYSYPGIYHYTQCVKEECSGGWVTKGMEVSMTFHPRGKGQLCVHSLPSPNLWHHHFPLGCVKARLLTHTHLPLFTSDSCEDQPCCPLEEKRLLNPSR